MKVLKYWKAIAVGLILGYIGFLNLRLWYHGIDLSPISLYSYKPAPYMAEYTKKWKKTKTETITGVTVVGKRIQSSSTKKSSDSQSKNNTSQKAPDIQAQTPSAQEFHLDGIQLGEWELKPLFYGGIASVQLDPSGVSHLEVTPNAPRLFELGKQRAIGISASYPLLRDHQISYSLYIYQDLLRVGPLWLRGQVEAENSPATGTDLSLQIQAEGRF